jgi:hypothetical protein
MPAGIYSGHLVPILQPRVSDTSVKPGVITVTSN